MQKLIIIFLTLCATAPAIAQKKVACIGASITYGATVPDREHNSFPSQLQALLGKDYIVSNYGVSGATLLSSGDHPYIRTNEYQQALQSNPDIVFIDLGGNDSKLINRVHMAEYEADYHALIRSFTQLPSHPRIILLGPVVSFVTDTTGIWDAVIVKQVIPHMQQVALQEGLEMLDMHPLLIDKPELLPDNIHPNAAGSGIMAKRLYDQLMVQRDAGFDIFKKLTVPTTVSAFYGYACADFTLDNHACKVVKPKWAAKGHPWIWRARFWGHEPQTDIALLERGYHVVYCDVAELLGNRVAIQTWNHFYDLLQKAGLARKAAMEGMSRGGVYVFNWAAENPDKVACVYVDNPVLDLKSWPGGLGQVKPDANVLPQLKADYGITTDAQLQQFKGSPVDKVKDIVKGKYPILILCADADEAVPPAENTLLFERKVKELHGNITVMHKPGFKHHPHSLPNPSPIVEFTLSAVTPALFIVQ
ncbi:MAG TPA: GDSL-type esterase/lipase family protein [Chitinophaga sp.]|uniref:GDSL-type esterase/lipase family protein n=1 Tax=Chitinophaga sp. TaxID=1869181 RepID=UPI002F92044A